MIERVVILNDLAEPKGGATALALASAMALRRRGLAVTFLCGDRGDNAALVAAGIEIVALGGERLLAGGKIRGLTNGLYNKDAGRLVRNWIARNDTDATVYHLHGWAQILSPAALGALRSVLARTVIHAHDFFLACPNGSYAFLRSGAVCPLTPMSLACISANCDRRAYAHKLWRVTRHALLKRVCDPARAPAILAIHAAMAPFLMRAGIPAGAIAALPNPVVPYSTTRIAAEANREFLFVGRLEGTKGPDLAAAAARAAGVPMRFVGDGAMRAELEARYPEFAFTGRLDAAGIAQAAAGARALVMPSRYPEPYGLVAAEALWSGLPVIAADTAFLTPDIARAGAGWGVAPRDVVAFADRLRAVADDDMVVRQSSIAAFEGTRTLGLSPDAWIDALIAAYEERLAARPLAA
jgi:glycosyltransferase involved in cell wall biosynthesis